MAQRKPESGKPGADPLLSQSKIRFTVNETATTYFRVSGGGAVFVKGGSGDPAQWQKVYVGKGPVRVGLVNASKAKSWIIVNHPENATNYLEFYSVDTAGNREITHSIPLVLN